MAEPPDDYDDAALDEMMMNGGDYAEPTSAELEMEFEMEREQEMGAPTGAPPTSKPGPPPAASQPPAEPEPDVGGVAIDEAEPPPPAEVMASFSLPDGEGQINLLAAPSQDPRKLAAPTGSLLSPPVASLLDAFAWLFSRLGRWVVAQVGDPFGNHSSGPVCWPLRHQLGARVTSHEQIGLAVQQLEKDIRHIAPSTKHQEQ